MVQAKAISGVTGLGAPALDKSAVITFNTSISAVSTLAPTPLVPLELHMLSIALVPEAARALSMGALHHDAVGLPCVLEPYLMMAAQIMAGVVLWCVPYRVVSVCVRARGGADLQ